MKIEMTVCDHPEDDTIPRGDSVAVTVNLDDLIPT